MRKFLLSLCAIAAITASAQDKQLVRIDTYSITTDESGIETSTFSNSSATNFYDKSNARIMDQDAYGNMRNFYTYNENGSVASKTVYSWDSSTGWKLSEGSSYTYQYDNEGNLVKSLSGTGGFIQYSGYQNGEYTKMENCGADGVPYYTANFNLIFNEQKKLTRRETLGQDGVTVQQFTNYTYNTDGKLATTHMAYMDEQGQESTTNYTDETYSYNADGSIMKIRVVSNGRWGLMTSDQVYVYANYSASYVPHNVKAAAGEASTVTVTWDAVAGAEGYVVIYDQALETVTATSFTTGSLLDGEHSFYVQAIVGGEAKNISDAATASVKDTGKLPAQNFKVVSVEPGETEWGGKAYNVTVQFTLPEGHSPVTGYKLFYGDSNWDEVNITAESASVEGNTVTMTGTIGEYAVSDYDTETYEYIPRKFVVLSAVVCYNSGDSERSNPEAWNFADNVSSITATTANTEVSSIYNLNGMKVNATRRGINIVKMTDGSVKKVMVK